MPTDVMNIGEKFHLNSSTKNGAIASRDIVDNDGHRTTKDN